ncbi:hypothetical protein BB559_003536 [Furculomyces boomerangus]|uniref:[histone H3]-dimethyl-L-lysine(36) demethylase n=1 Tax=Furculomyces boomerangus TaxID=61424 RepID=A0A2T9YKP5_9FUNG|nr:hypothetical protein BB559_007035 [Furculomyces boomerangus]PVU85674.1 hypothetical protein BB559_006867 [Furculomyces boomerangus]PVU92907.1 hypothetical protein BB559_003536 [Furculomyces boomerangus]
MVLVDVQTQEELGLWSMEKWTNYYESTSKRRILNVISLEVSDTKLTEIVKRPKLVDDLDVIQKYWPKSLQKVPGTYPKVQLYCLMSPKNAFTDFHIDFSATWARKKIFYLIPPTKKNLGLFEKWSLSENQYLTVFSSLVSAESVARVVLNPGNTLIMPAGWIHAVTTLEDSIVFGGNFIVLETMQMHIKIYKMEERLGIKDVYRLPYFVTLCEWTILFLEKFMKNQISKEENIKNISSNPRSKSGLELLVCNKTQIPQFLDSIKELLKFVYNKSSCLTNYEYIEIPYEPQKLLTNTDETLNNKVHKRKRAKTNPESLHHHDYTDPDSGLVLSLETISRAIYFIKNVI